MKVTFCAYDRADYFCGPNAWLRRLLPDLRGQGIDVRVLCITHSDPASCPTVVALQKQGIACTSVVKHDFIEDRIRWILVSLRDDPPDLFVPHLMLPALYAARWVREAGIPTIGVMHSSDNFYYGLLSEFVLGSPEYNLSALVTVSRYLEYQVISRKPQKTIIRRIPRGVPVPSLTPHYPDGVLRLIDSGRLTEEAKRISEVTHALCKVVRVVHGTEAYIYGDGEGRFAVEKILSQEGEDIPVFFKGSVDSDTIQEHLLNGHIFVLLSDYEGLPISLMEAMACGLVPVCLEIKGGVSELIDNGLNGFKVSDRSDSLIAAVEKLRGDRGLWMQLSTQARATIENKYAHKGCVSLWGQLFEELVPSNRESREIVLPRQIKLPPINSGLAREDQRSLSGFSLVKRNLTGVLKNLGRHLSPFISRSPSS